MLIMFVFAGLVDTTTVNCVLDNAGYEPWFGQNDTVTVLFTQNHGPNSKTQEHIFVVDTDSFRILW
jgi:hypothetical protein